MIFTWERMLLVFYQCVRNTIHYCAVKDLSLNFKADDSYFRLCTHTLFNGQPLFAFVRSWNIFIHILILCSAKLFSKSNLKQFWPPLSSGCTESCCVDVFCWTPLGRFVGFVLVYLSSNKKNPVFCWQQQFQVNAEWFSVTFSECQFNLPGCCGYGSVPSRIGGRRKLLRVVFVFGVVCGFVPSFVRNMLKFMATKCKCLSPLVCPCQDIKNADLALYELNRVITLEPSWPEVYEQRAEVRGDSVANVIYY